MTKKAAAPAEKKKTPAPKAEPKVEPKVVAKAAEPRVHATKPSSNPFTQARPGSPNRSANNGQPGSRRGR